MLSRHINKPDKNKFNINWGCYRIEIVNTRWMPFGHQLFHLNNLWSMLQVAIVVGGGNIFRGSSWAGCSGLDRSSADYIGYSPELICCLCISHGNLFITNDHSFYNGFNLEIYSKRWNH